MNRRGESISSDVRQLHRELLAVACQAARAGAAIAAEFFGRGVEVEFKRDGSEVSAADRAAEAACVAAIRAARPHDPLIAEEAVSAGTGAAAGDSDAGTAAVVWAIDPIDGTRNFVRGIPLYACSVGALFEGVPVAGAIMDPSRDVLYSASLGEGAFLNGAPLRVVDGDERTLLAAIPSKSRDRARVIVHHWVDRLVIRNFGSSALHLAMVAAGQLDAVLATDARLWDIAAGAVLIEAAGGRVSAPDGSAIFPFDVRSYNGGEIPTLAAGPLTHARLVRPGMP
ncbi:MAG: Inositol-1-monophosphatase [Phycisphaerae bacterium]|nr:Inositol-1-monophosphatase [Phycisphaerae bacterium]